MLRSQPWWPLPRLWHWQAGCYDSHWSPCSWAELDLSTWASRCFTKDCLIRRRWLERQGLVTIATMHTCPCGFLRMPLQTFPRLIFSSFPKLLATFWKRLRPNMQGLGAGAEEQLEEYWPVFSWSPKQLVPHREWEELEELGTWWEQHEPKLAKEIKHLLLISKSRR